MSLSLTRPELARYVEHTLLKPDATRTAIQKLCEEAREHRFHAVYESMALALLKRVNSSMKAA